MKYFTYQGNDHDCGFASLKILLATLSKQKSYLFLPKPKKREKYNLQELVQIAESYGVELEAFGCDEKYFSSLKAPCLTIIDDNHVVFVKKRKRNNIIYYDPDKGKVKMSKRRFLYIWRKITIEVKDKKFIKKIPKYKTEILPKKISLFETIFSVLSSTIIVATFYLLNDIENAFYSLIFLSIFLLFQIVEKIMLHKEIYLFDKKYISLFFSKTKNQTKLKYLEFIEFKEKYFTNNRSLLSSIIVSFLITFLLCFNDFRNVFVLLTLLLIKTVDIIMFSKTEQRYKERVSEYESKCFNSKSDFSVNAFRANRLANLIGAIRSIKSVSYLVISFLFALFMMYLTGNNGCNYVIFHFVLYYFGSNSLSEAINGLSNRKDMMKEKIRFLDACNL